MKRLLTLLLCLLLLAACTAPETPTDTTKAPVLTGVWVNAGQYSQGRDFVETLTLREDGAASVHLDYQGKDYQTLRGSYTVSEGVLSVTYADQSGSFSRSFQYTRDGRELILKTEAKTVTYIKID